MSMDSAASLSPFGTRDSSPVAEDDGALSIVAELAKDAALLFQAGKFVECLRILNQLLQKKEGDPKVRHNIDIVKIFQDGCSDSKRFIEAIENIKKQQEEISHASEEHLEVASDNGCKSAAATSDEFDTSLSMLNVAVVWFYLHEYEKSFSYLDTLYQNIEPIDEGTSLRICLLLLDVALFSHHASRSADVINYMEKVFCVNSLNNQVDNGTLAQQQFLLVSKASSLSSNSNIPDASSDSVTANTLENSLSRTLSDEALEDEPLQLLSSLGEGIQRLYAIASSNDISRSQAEELRLKLHLYKVQFFLLTQNLKAAKREVKMAMNIPRAKDSPMAFYLKSQLEYSRGNHRKAIKLLIASSNRTEIGTSSMYYNNLGCIYYQMGKHHTSGLFFSKALNNSLILRKGKLPKLAQDKSLLITYNCGIHSLACGRPYHAARCFQTASLIFYNRPLLWLRIAECCIMALEKGHIKSISSTSDRSDVKVYVIGKGKWRHLALRPPESGFVGNDNLLPNNGKNSNLSISLARQCLFNALYLLESSKTKFSSSKESETLGEMKEQKVGDNLSSSLHNSIPEYEITRMKENEMIKQAALADLAYAELALENPLQALSTARSLLKNPNCSRIYVFLGTMYAAEALCLLHRPKEAAEHLMIYISGGNTVELPYTQEDCKKFVHKFVDNEVSSADESIVSQFLQPEEARGIFYANYAANLALLGDMEKAYQFVMNALSDIPNSSKAILTAIYVDLKCGKTQEALAKLKQHNSIRFLPGSLPLNGAS